MRQYPTTIKSQNLFRFFSGEGFVTFHLSYLKKEKEKYVHPMKRPDRAKLVHSANRWSVLHASSSPPHDPIPPNLISETLFPVAQMALQMPEGVAPEVLRTLPHLAYGKMMVETEGGQAGWKFEPGKATSQEGTGSAQRPTPECHSVRYSCGITHEGLGGRPGGAAASQPGRQARGSGLSELGASQASHSGPTAYPPARPAPGAGKGSGSPAEGRGRGRRGRGRA